MNKSICFIQFSFEYSQGNQALYEYAKELKKTYNKVNFINISRSNKKQLSVKVKKQKLFNFSHLKFLMKTVDILSKKKYDLVHVTNLPGAFIIKICTPNIQNWILDIRSGSISSSSYRRIIFDLFTKLNLAFFRNILFISEGLKKEFTDYIKNKRTGLSPIGVDIKEFNSKTNKIDTLKSELNFIYIGSLDKPRKPINMIKAFIASIKKGNDIKLTIIGKGSELRVLKELVKKNGLDEKIIFTGFIKYSEIPKYLKESNVGVAYIPITSGYNVQPPLKTIEYMAAGLPVLATNTDGNKQFVVNHHNGIVIKDSVDDLTKGINYFVNNQKLIPRMSKKAIKTAKQNSWVKVVSNYIIPFYEAIIQEDRETKA
jgi:glycosyltransferase involved in cell wall biosynthesis